METAIKNLNYMRGMVQLLKEGKLKEVIARLDFTSTRTKCLLWTSLDPGNPGFRERLWVRIRELCAFEGIEWQGSKIIFKKESHEAQIGELNLESKTVFLFTEKAHDCDKFKVVAAAMKTLGFKIVYK